MRNRSPEIKPPPQGRWPEAAADWQREAGIAEPASPEPKLLQVCGGQVDRKLRNERRSAPVGPWAARIDCRAGNA